ncbi:hypothetical protein BHM03_00043732 [Ensete ventricosum]|nr:hypothetical protein BHM03_00043732 [Ensete ventricosum]
MEKKRNALWGREEKKRKQKRKEAMEEKKEKGEEVAEKKREKNLVPPRAALPQFPRAICRPWVKNRLRDPSLAGDSFSTRGEKERGDYWVAYCSEINSICWYGSVWKTLLLNILLITDDIRNESSPRSGSVKNRSTTVDFGRRWPIEVEIDRRRSIEREINRRRSIEEEKGKKRKRKKKKRGRKNTSLARRPRPPAVTAHGSPARRRRPRVAHGRFFSRARRQSVSLREETDRGDVSPFSFSFF